MSAQGRSGLLILGLAIASVAISAEPQSAKLPAAEVSLVKSQVVPAPAKTVAASGRMPADRLDLDVSVVTGNRELPKVLYIVPWKKAELGDLPEQPFNSLLDEALKPIDRDEFRLEVTYYSKLAERPDAADARSEQKSPIAPTTSR